MDTSKLPDDTREVWETLRETPRLKGFVLIGGTALTLRIGHRISEDLDFAYVAGPRLPRQRIEMLARETEAEGISMRLNQSPVAVEEFHNDGLDLADYQMNYVALDAVKVTFVRLDSLANKIFEGERPDEPLRVATTAEIFATKCLVCADRSKTRDWFDLWVLMTRHGFTMDDFYRVFQKYDAASKYDIASMRLRSGRPDPGDEGYEQLLTEAPALPALTDFFARGLDDIETRQAAFAFRALRQDGKLGK